MQYLLCGNGTIWTEFLDLSVYIHGGYTENKPPPSQSTGIELVY